MCVAASFIARHWQQPAVLGKENEWPGELGCGRRGPQSSQKEETGPHVSRDFSVIKRRERKQFAGGCREDHLYKVLNHAIWCYIT